MLEHIHVGIMSVVGYDGEKLKRGKLDVLPKMEGGCFWEFLDTLQLLELPGNGSPAESYFSQGQAHFRSNSHPVTALCRPNMGNSERSCWFLSFPWGGGGGLSLCLDLTVSCLLSLSTSAPSPGTDPTGTS